MLLSCALSPSAAPSSCHCAHCFCHLPPPPLPAHCFHHSSPASSTVPSMLVPVYFRKTSSRLGRDSDSVRRCTFISLASAVILGTRSAPFSTLRWSLLPCHNRSLIYPAWRMACANCWVDQSCCSKLKVRASPAMLRFNSSGVLVGCFEVMRGKQDVDAEFFVELLDVVPQHLAAFDVEAEGGFVEEHH